MSGRQRGCEPNIVSQVSRSLCDRHVLQSLSTAVYEEAPNIDMIVLVRKDPVLPGPAKLSMADQSSSPLLCLPPELRNAIYYLLLVHHLGVEKAIPLHRLPASTSSLLNQQRLCANILLACRQTNEEGTPILYGENMFMAHASLLAALPSYLLAGDLTRCYMSPVTCPRVAKMIRRFYLHVRLDTDARFTKSQVEESFTDVDCLEIEVFQAMYGSCDFSVLQLFEGVRGVGKAVVKGSVGDGNYADWLAKSMMSPVGTLVPAFSEEYIGGNHVWHAWVNGNR